MTKAKPGFNLLSLKSHLSDKITVASPSALLVLLLNNLVTFSSALLTLSWFDVDTHLFLRENKTIIQRCTKN
jgi:hypothetical protein